MKSYQSFINPHVDEKEAEGKGEDKGTVKPPEEAVDTSEGTIRVMTIDGTKYNAVLSTYNAIASKQAGIGESEVGMITLPGKDQVWELLLLDEKKNADKEEPKGDKEESKEEKK
jgi:hypothetical protein